MSFLLATIRAVYGRHWPPRVDIFETRWPVRRPALELRA